MPRTNSPRRFVELLESIADSSSRMARSMEDAAVLEREKTGWLHALFGRFWRRGGGSTSAGPRRYKSDGGLSDGARPPPIGPGGSGGTIALPSGDRPCINVTPQKVSERGRVRK